ncbi:MAG: NAD(FAD)-utilizing dehydrogenase [Clostridia bacterium]|nr:NAD(FAD)-utilizing dehydrogenase [Clostridia bacterium]
MYRISEIKLNIDEPKDRVREKIEKKIRCKVLDYTIVKESLDSRNKDKIMWVYTVDFTADRRLNLEEAPNMEYVFPIHGSEKLNHRPVVIGFGPCGMLCALVLAQEGYMPIVYERGQSQEERVKSVEEFLKTGKLNPESNVQFGEGGAGTFSDGKLTTGIKDKRIRKVLREFVNFGAPEEILYKQKPHVGTDILRNVVKGIREEIIRLGGEVNFNSKLEDICFSDGKLTGIVVSGKRIETDVLVLAIGHSARDTFRMLKGKLDMEQKPFSMGFRIEHPQDLIDIAQYGKPARELGLPAADYKLSCHTSKGRGVYTFCMCPGGHIICAASSEGMTLTNGMSYSDRASGRANSALLCDVRPEDFESVDPLSGVEFQEKYERLAFVNGGKNYAMPKTTLGEFVSGKENPVTNSLPNFVVDNIIEAVPMLGRKLKGFDSPDALVVGVESRSSSPVRILRDQGLQTKIKGIYPGGEGAGYAGGITSSACDGIRIAEQIISKYGGENIG